MNVAAGCTSGSEASRAGCPRDARGLQLFDVREPPADLKVGKG
jgi:hypothetical protein